MKADLEKRVSEVPSIHPIHQDLSNLEDTRDTEKQLEELNGLVNCADVSTPFASVIVALGKHMNFVLDVNLRQALT